MNIRTNLRTARQESIFIIMVAVKGRDASRYIRATWIATATSARAAKLVYDDAERYANEDERVFMIRFDKDAGITTPADAIATAIESIDKSSDN